MKIGVMSDLHSDHNAMYNFGEILTDPELDCLIIPGDISGNFEDTVETIKDISRHNKLVVVVLGNHDYYSDKQLTIKQVHKAYEDAFSKIDNVVFLNNSSYQLGKYKLSGTTGWFPGRFGSPPFPDFKQILFFERDRQDEYEKGVRFLESNQSPNTIFITHHTPYEFLMPQLPPDHENKNFYCMKLPRTLECCMWLYGHTHIKLNQERHNIKYINNPFGYYYEDLQNILSIFELD